MRITTDASYSRERKTLFRANDMYDSWEVSDCAREMLKTNRP